MKRLHLIIIPLICCMLSCVNRQRGFVHDPSKPYPLLNPGDFWPEKFDQRGLQNAVIHQGRLYCNTIDVGGKGNYLYCMDTASGLVTWRAQLEAYATQPASFLHDTVICCSYLGDITVMDAGGKAVWNAKFSHPYGGHWVDTLNKRLLVTTVYWKNTTGYDIRTGKIIAEIENDSLQKLIKSKTKAGQGHVHEFHFIHNGKNYTITVKT